MRKSFAIGLLALGCAASASGEDKGRFGFDAILDGTTNLGVTWRVGDHLALRPTLGFRHTTADTQTELPPAVPGPEPSVRKRSENRFAGGLSLLWFVRGSDALSPYLGASYERSHLKISSSSSLSVPVLPTPTTTDGDLGRVFLGAQHAFGARFASFGELGLEYSDQDAASAGSFSAFDPVTQRSTFYATQVHTHTKVIGSFNAAIGVVFYLK